MTHPLIEAVARELDCPPDKARAAVLATLRGLCSPSETALGEVDDHNMRMFAQGNQHGAPFEDLLGIYLFAAMSEIGGPMPDAAQP